MRYSWGELEVDIICESVAEFFLASEFFPQFDANAIVHRRERLQPDFLTSDNRLRLSIHSWLLRAGDLNILIDTCVGNQKKRPSIAQWNQAEFSYLDGLTETGCSVEDIDIVMCTHLHVDHVGWNTRLEDNRWIPTFPNARYLFSGKEYEYYLSQNRISSANRGSFDDSVLPIVAAGQAEFIGSGYTLAPGVIVQEMPGHTPGHFVIRIERNGLRAILSGDVVHHPMQIWHPEWASVACWDPQAAGRSRIELLNLCVESGALLLPAHFCSPHGAKITKYGSHFDFRWGEKY